MKEKHLVHIGLGSNLGDKIQNILIAMEHIQKENKIVKSSSFYSSEPWGFESDSFFVNSVLLIETIKNPEELFIFLKRIEQEMGRVKTKEGHYEDRIIDLDILLYGNLLISTNSLSIPHKEITNRRFVLEPLCEISAETEHPLLQKNFSDLLEKCEDKSVLQQISVKM